MYYQIIASGPFFGDINIIVKDYIPVTLIEKSDMVIALSSENIDDLIYHRNEKCKVVINKNRRYFGTHPGIVEFGGEAYCFTTDDNMITSVLRYEKLKKKGGVSCYQ